MYAITILYDIIYVSMHMQELPRHMYVCITLIKSRDDLLNNYEN